MFIEARVWETWNAPRDAGDVNTNEKRAPPVLVDKAAVPEHEAQ